MKKGIFSSVIILGALLGIILGIFFDDSQAKVSYAAAAPEGDISIDEEYLIPDHLGWCTYYVVLATNTTGSDISISADFVARDKSGKLLRKVNDYSDAVKDGQQFILYGQFLSSAIGNAASFEYTYTINPTDRCAYSSVSLSAAKSEGCLEVSATNKAAADLQIVGVRTVFIKDGKAVAFDTVNIADEGWLFRSGSTNSQYIGEYTGDYDHFIMTYTAVSDRAMPQNT